QPPNRPLSLLNPLDTAFLAEAARSPALSHSAIAPSATRLPAPAPIAPPTTPPMTPPTTVPIPGAIAVPIAAPTVAPPLAPIAAPAVTVPPRSAARPARSAVFRSSRPASRDHWSQAEVPAVSTVLPRPTHVTAVVNRPAAP